MGVTVLQQYKTIFYILVNRGGGGGGVIFQVTKNQFLFEQQKEENYNINIKS